MGNLAVRLALALIASLLIAPVAHADERDDREDDDGREEREDGDGRERRVRWHGCYPDAGPSFECATVRVPLDYDRAHGRRISLALVRLPASDPDRRRRKGRSIFLNPGGPGGSGVDFVLGAGPFLFSDEVRARFDLVGFDPRGIAQSSPLLCFRTLDEAGACSRRSPSP